MPVPAGDHLSMIAPCGKPMKANRFGVEPAAVCAHAVAAGFIASSSGSAMVAPTPFSTVQREICFFVKNIVVLVGRGFSPGIVLLYFPTLATFASGAAAWGTRCIRN